MKTILFSVFVTITLATAAHADTWGSFTWGSGTWNLSSISNGSCGTSNGGTFTVIPTSSLCTTGTANSVTGSGPWSWTCNGSGGGTTTSCSANVAIPSATKYTVTPSPGSNGSLSPPTAQSVANNSTTSFLATPAPSYQLFAITGCGGTLSGSTYTTGPITGNCTVTASFSSLSAVSHDGVVTTATGRATPDISDALAVLRYSVGLISLTGPQLIHADVAPLGSNGTPLGNGVLDAADVIAILRRSIGIGSW